MGARGWMINLSGRSIPVYGMQSNETANSNRLGQLTNNECFTKKSIR